MKTIKLTLFLLLTCVCASAQIDTTELIFGDWYIDGGRTLNIDVEEQATFSRINNDSLFLKWTFSENNQFVRSGVFKSPDKNYPIGFKSKPSKWSFNKGQGEILIVTNGHGQEFKIVSLDVEIFTISRLK